MIFFLLSGLRVGGRACVIWRLHQWRASQCFSFFLFPSPLSALVVSLVLTTRSSSYLLTDGTRVASQWHGTIVAVPCAAWFAFQSESHLSEQLFCNMSAQWSMKEKANWNATPRPHSKNKKQAPCFQMSFALIGMQLPMTGTPEINLLSNILNLHVLFMDMCEKSQKSTLVPFRQKANSHWSSLEDSKECGEHPKFLRFWLSADLGAQDKEICSW